jgi:hypothetical protein
MSITVIYHTMSDYYISITNKGDMSITMIYHTIITVIDVSLLLVILIQYSQRHSMINHCDRHITLLSDTYTVQSET